MRKLVVELRLIYVEINATACEPNGRRKCFTERPAGKLPGQLARGLASIRCESRHINQRLDVSAVLRRVRDDLTTVGVTDEDHRATDASHNV